MFEPSQIPRCFALPLGCDFSISFLQGLRFRLKDMPPEAMGRVEIFVNTRRTERRLHDLLLEGAPGFLPRIRVISDLANDPLICRDIPKAISPLRRRLELSRTIAALLDAEPELAPRTAIFDLADGLASLMDEMHGEGVSAKVFQSLEIDNDFAAHWQRSLKFLNILAPYFEDTSAPDNETRQRLVVEHLTQEWAENPPDHPIIVAGSTGSRGATALFMQAVSRLPQGAVVLPGFDFDMPADIFGILADNSDTEMSSNADHPQAGLVKFIHQLGLGMDDLEHWENVNLGQSRSARNKLVSLALRPAPVTDQWLSEGPNLGDLADATAGMSILNAPSPRLEALSIALCLRQAAEDGRKATLISPDRQLTRAVTAALARWNILPDDSAGRPLPLLPPGIFLRLICENLNSSISSENLLVILKHPLCHSLGEGRNLHLLRTRELEMEILRGGAPEPDFKAIRLWAAERKGDAQALRWVDWLEACFSVEHQTAIQPLSDHLQQHRKMAENVVAGPDNDDRESNLWEKPAGIEAARLFKDLEESADAAGNLSAFEYRALFRSVLNTGEVREPLQVHPDITIWGTLEARVQGADLVILGGLNDGIWPKLPAHDPWLNRVMRAKAGLLLPERRIGLSAHDFQQAIAAPEVMLSRSVRDADAPTVASRWMIRLTNLLSGLGDNGVGALAAMEARGNHWQDMASALEEPRFKTEPAQRPSPKPPVSARPKRLSVTQIKTLIRDPFAIYARNVLRLKKLERVRREPDAMLRGQALHQVLEDFVASTLQDLPENAADHLLAMAAEIFETQAPWPATRRLWLARLGHIADSFVASEIKRRERGAAIGFEVWGKAEMTEPEFTLVGKADRIDQKADGALIIYDYKTGAIPTQPQVNKFDKQLPLEGAMANRGAFEDIDPSDVSGLEYVGMGREFRVVSLKLDDDQINEAWEGLRNLIRAYQRQDQGYTARARMEERKDKSDYDHLSRFGEWLDSDPLPTPTKGGVK